MTTRGAWPVRAYVALALATLMLVTALGLAVMYRESADRASAQARERMRTQAELAAWTIDQTVASARVQVESLATQPSVEDALARPGACLLAAGESSAFSQVRLGVVTREGEVACSSDPDVLAGPTGVHHGSDWLAAVLAAPGTVVLWDTVDPATGRAAIAVGHAFPVAGAPAQGAVVYFVDVGAAADDLAEAVGLASDSVLTVVDSVTGRVVSASGPDAEDLVGATADVGAVQGVTAGPDGVAREVERADVEGGRWQVLAGVEQASIVADARESASTIAVLAALALVGIGVVAWVAQRRIAQPLRALTAAVTRARTAAVPGEARVEVTGTAEIESLAREFNTLLDVRAGHEARLAHQATHDRLTGLANKDLLRERLVGRPGGGSRERASVLCVGLNRFQTISDSLGHDGADQVLVEASARLIDALPAGATLVRDGGQDFMVHCPGVTIDGATVIAERLLAALTGPIAVGGATIVLNASIGIAQQEAASSPERLLREADTAMARARTLGIDWVVFDTSMQRRATRYLETEQALRSALVDHQIVVHYQPLVDLTNGRITGAEALVRWQHPTRGLVPPLEFIPVAEETGQIGAIGELVLREACGQAARWADDGHVLRVSVNVSGAQLQDGSFAGLVTEVLGATGLPADRLCLEVTESTLISWATHSRTNLDRLRATGVQLSIDDFGTGYSSLAYLHDLPMDELKIDRSFVVRLERDLRDQHLVEAVLGMARALGLSVVAEGVETADQRAILLGLGCRCAQGYHFAAPQTADRFAALLHAHDHDAALPTPA